MSDDVKVEKAQKSKKLDYLFLGMCIFFVLVILMTIFLNIFILGSVYVEGDSMLPTLNSGDVLFMNINTQSENGDIIVIKDEKSDLITGDSQLIIKRQIAKGQKGKIVIVELLEGKVYVDGQEITQTYLPQDTQTNPIEDDKSQLKTRWELKENEIFYLGDNRGNSYDSRYYQYDLCDQSQVVGVVKEWAVSLRWFSRAIYDVKTFFTKNI